MARNERPNSLSQTYKPATYFEVALEGIELTYGDTRQVILTGLIELLDRAGHPAENRGERLRVMLLDKKDSRVL